jgi:hypothetical protein
MTMQGYCFGRWAQFLVALLFIASNAGASSFSYSGTFARDDNMLILPITLGGPGTLTLRTLGYAGGVTSAGSAIRPGGFDPIVSLFNASSGALIGLSDDGIGVPADPGGTGEAFDSLLTMALAAGTYDVVLTEYDNFPNGLRLSDGFSEAGQGNFTSAFGCAAARFCDSDGNSRTSTWALDIIGASSVPEPATLGLLAIGLITLRLCKRDRPGSRCARASGAPKSSALMGERS